MKKKKILIVIVLFIGIIGIWTYKKYKPLPVGLCSSTYPDYSLSELVRESQNIVYGTVTQIGETQMREVLVSTTLDPSEATDVLYYPITPVTIRIINAVKGNKSSEIIYYEESGRTSTYVQIPQGYQMKKGMEVILFLNDLGYGWGSQSVYPVIEDQVILQEKVETQMQQNEISNHLSVETIKNKYGISSSFEDEMVSTVSIDEFIELINTYQ